MSRRKCFFTTIHLAALFLFLLEAAFAQQEPTTADEVIAKYLAAIGADRYASITTFMEIGENYGNLRNFLWGNISPWQYGEREHGTFQFYFKSPNLRFGSDMTDQRQIIQIHGCDGKVSWYIFPNLRRIELKPKPGKEYDCEEGLSTPLRHLNEPKVKKRLEGKKDIDGHMAWHVKADDPRATYSENYYFDADTFLLVRMERAGLKVTYSDYRDVGGFKFAFTTVQELTNSKLVTTVRELKINTAIDDEWFAERQLKNGVVDIDPAGLANGKKVEAPKNASPELSAAAKADAPGTPTNATAQPAAATSTATAPSNAPGAVEVNFPNFASSPLAEIQAVVPELKTLKPAPDQEQLHELLEKVGAKTLDIARNTPNLISRETVTQSESGGKEMHHDYDYLILARVEGGVVNLDEFRVDLKSGEKFQTDDDMTREEVERASRELTAAESGVAPASQGFATSWVHFYPHNQLRNSYRYLGEQKMDGQRTLVLAFAQNPATVIRPALFLYRGKSLPMLLQGVAWVDPTDFRIVRLRTDLLAPLAEVGLHRLTADIRFSMTQIEQVPMPLSLPNEVSIESGMEGGVLRETHKYSGYRLFRAHSRVVMQ